MKIHRLSLLNLAVSILVVGIVAHANAQTSRITGESLIFEEETPSKLMFEHADPVSFRLRSTYLPDLEHTIDYEAGRDFILHAEEGILLRTPTSRIPDFRDNILYDQVDFDHSKFPGFGNTHFFAFADYTSRVAKPMVETTDQADLLQRSQARLEAGGTFKIVAYGDSITEGGDATMAKLRFTQRYAAYLRGQYPKAEITLENGATGGDNTRQGIARLEEKVLTREPDLVLIGFGMNDHNVNGVAVREFQDNLHTMINRIRERTDAEIMLFSAFPPNPDWKFGSNRMAEYAEATRRVADEAGCAFADVYSVWMKVLARKGRHSLLGNNINHPNDFGHWLYCEALTSVKF